MILLACLLGCAVTVASAPISAAERSLEQARAAGAREATSARYPLTMAERYLDKAREEALEAEYRAAAMLAEASEAWARRAIEAAGAPPDLEALPEDRDP